MILVDTSVWVSHFRQGEAELVDRLERNEVLIHAFVVGELACGNLRDREAVLGLLLGLPAVVRAEEDEVLYYIARHALAGRGLGYIDMHLLTATALHGDARLWTLDRRFRDVAAALRLNYDP